MFLGRGQGSVPSHAPLLSVDPLAPRCHCLSSFCRRETRRTVWVLMTVPPEQASKPRVHRRVSAGPGALLSHIQNVMCLCICEGDIGLQHAARPCEGEIASDRAKFTLQGEAGCLPSPSSCSLSERCARPSTTGLDAVEMGAIQGHQPGELHLFVRTVQVTSSVPGGLPGQRNGIGCHRNHNWALGQYDHFRI